MYKLVYISKHAYLNFRCTNECEILASYAMFMLMLINVNIKEVNTP